MSSQDKPAFSGHPEERLLLYLENELEPDLRNQVEEHLRDCPQCVAELEKMDFTISSLKANHEVFCPEPWELYEFVDEGGDSGGRISRHLEQCPLCREEIALYAAKGKPVETPDVVRKAFAENFPLEPGPVEPRVPRRGLSAILGVILSALHHPTAALAYAAAAILIVVLAYPRGEIAPVMALSRVTWTEPGAGLSPQKARIDLQLMGPSPSLPTPEKAKPRVAALLFFKGFPRPMPQESIDDLYRALKPTSTIVKRYTMIAPGQVRSEMLSVSTRPKMPDTELLKTMRSQLGVDEALLLTVATVGNRFNIVGELARTSDGEILGKAARANVDAGELAAKLREAAFRLLIDAE